MKTNNNNIFFLSAILLYLLHHVPIIGELTPNVIYLLIVLLLFFSTISYAGNRFGKYLLIALAICSIQISRELVFTSSFGVWLYSFIQCITTLVLGLAIVDRQDYRLARYILIIVIICYSVTAITTFYGNTIIPGASRMLAASSDQYVNERSQIAMLNIGGFAFIYIMALFVPILIGALKVPIIPRVLTIVIVILFLATIYKSEYAIALLVSSSALVLLFMLRGTYNQKNSWKFLLVAVVAFFISAEVISSFLNIISDTTESNLISGRFSEVAEYIIDSQSASNDKTSDLASRKNLYAKSFKAFTENPFFGTKDPQKIGGHSLFFDGLGLFGIFGLALYILMLSSIFKHYLKWIRNRPFFGFFFYSYLMSIVLTIVNPHLFLYFYSFVLPASVVWFSFKDDEANHLILTK